MMNELPKWQIPLTDADLNLIAQIEADLIKEFGTRSKVNCEHAARHIFHSYCRALPTAPAAMAEAPYRCRICGGTVSFDGTKPSVDFTTAGRRRDK